MLVTHAHGDHVGDTLAIAKESGAKVVTNYDLCMYLAAQGLENFDPMNHRRDGGPGRGFRRLHQMVRAVSFRRAGGAGRDLSARQQPTA